MSESPIGPICLAVAQMQRLATQEAGFQRISGLTRRSPFQGISQSRRRNVLFWGLRG
jgi:hypothetical protein